MILDLNKDSCEFQVVGEIAEVYHLDDKMKIIEPIKLHHDVYKHNEIKKLLNYNLNIIFLSINIKRKDDCNERIDIYDVCYVDIINDENEYQRYVNYIKSNTYAMNKLKYEIT